MTVKTLVPSDKAQARMAGDKLPKTNGEASLFQGILKKEIEKSRPVAQAPAMKDKGKLSDLQTIKDDGKAQTANLVLIKPQPKKTETRSLEGGDPLIQDPLAQAGLATLNQTALPVIPESGVQVKKPVLEDKISLKASAEGEGKGDQKEDPRTRRKDKLTLVDPTAPMAMANPETKVIQVLDRRSSQDKTSESKTREQASIQEASASAQKTKGQEEITIQYTSTTGFTPEGAGGKIQAPITRAAADGLFRNLQDKANLEIVDKARIVLRDDNQGEIRLIIKPEALGEVKIRLNLDDGRLAGQIIVENNTVKDVFQNNMQSLLDSFRDGGFTGLDIQVSVGSEGNSKEFRERTALLDSYNQNTSLQPALDENLPVQNQHYWMSGQLNMVV